MVEGLDTAETETQLALLEAMTYGSIMAANSGSMYFLPEPFFVVAIVRDIGAIEERLVSHN